MQSRSPKSSRRDFLKMSAAAGVVLAASPSLAAAQRSPNERVRIAAVGVGGKGWSNIEAAAKYGDVVALCDVDSGQLARGKAQYSGAREFADFRQMLDQMTKEIDLVIVSTPDHTHAVAAAAAMRRGHHVYCEKPLTRTIWEARELAKIARRAKVATQMGNQGTAQDGLRKMAALLANNTWGDVKEIHCWTDRAKGWWPQGVGRGAPAEPPSHLSWDLWLGPSAERPYSVNYHPFAWRGWWDFGSGAMGDIACHCMNLPFMAYRMKDPIAVQATTSGHNRDSFPLSSVINYEFRKSRTHPALKLVWYDGGNLPPASLAPGQKLESNGCLIICERATIYSGDTYGAYQAVVGGGEIPDIEFVKSPGHMEELINAIKGGPAPMANIPDYAAPMTEMALVGNLAVWANGPRLEWDARRMRVKGTSEYDSLIKPQYRKGWSL